MDKNQFSWFRSYLGKTQNELASLLCLSPKAVQSFEEGWRNIPTYVERQLLLLLFLKNGVQTNTRPCWEIRKCSGECRGKCVAWEYRSSDYCWYITGTYCQGRRQDNWAEKMDLCRQCVVFHSLLPALSDRPSTWFSETQSSNKT